MSYIFLALLRLFNIATYIPVGSFKQTFIFVWYTPIPRATLQTLLSFLCSIRYTYTLVLLTNRNCLLRNLFCSWWLNVDLLFSKPNIESIITSNSPIWTFDVKKHMEFLSRRLQPFIFVWHILTHNLRGFYSTPKITAAETRTL